MSVSINTQRFLSLWCRLLLLIVVTQAQTQRRKLDAFTITLHPMEEALTMEEASDVRNSVETVLQEFFRSTYSWPQGTAVTYVGLARVLENTLAEESAVQVTMDGLVYFTDQSSPPTSAVLLQLLATALPPNTLLATLLPSFPQLESAALASPPPPTTTTTLEPSTPAPTTTTEQEEEDDDDPTINSLAKEQSTESSTKSPIGIIAGGTVAGLAFVLFGLLLFSIHIKRSKVMTSTTDDRDDNVWKTETIQKKTGHTTPSPTKTDVTDRSDEDIERPEATSSLGNLFVGTKNNMQMMDDDLSSCLDFNVDDLVEDFDDHGTTTTQNNNAPHDIIAVESVESFEHRRQQQHVLKKDMLDSINTSLKQPNWGQNPNDKTYQCALEPTDVSAATLAIKPRQSSTTTASSLVPKLAWFTSNTKRTIDVNQSDGDTGTFGGDWDPDDQSSMASGTSDVFLKATVENKDEQSLLHHSLRNESYKMQRLRTPQIQQHLMIHLHDDNGSDTTSDDFDSPVMIL
jgi:hypothetical protein